MWNSVISTLGARYAGKDKDVLEENLLERKEAIQFDGAQEGRICVPQD